MLDTDILRRTPEELRRRTHCSELRRQAWHKGNKAENMKGKQVKMSSKHEASVLGKQNAEGRWLQREEELRREVASLEERLRGLEFEKGDLMAASSDSTRPLLK